MMIREMKKELKYGKRDKIKGNEKVDKYEKDNISDIDKKQKNDSNCIFCGNKKGIQNESPIIFNCLSSFHKKEKHSTLLNHPFKNFAFSPFLAMT